MKIREHLKAILHVSDSPRNIAISFSTGIFIAFSPLLGLHTVLALALAWTFKLNKLVILAGVFVNNPWTIIPMYSFATWVGTLILGSEKVLPDIDWTNMEFSSLLNELSYLLMPFAVGTTIVGFVFAVISYYIIIKAVERARAARISEETK